MWVDKGKLARQKRRQHLPLIPKAQAVKDALMSIVYMYVMYLLT